MVDLDVLKSSILKAGSLPLRESIAIPMSAYNSQALYDFEVENIFRPGWLPIGRVDQVSEPNSYVSVDIVGEPLVMTRDAEGEFHVFSRLCPHRGMELVRDKGKASVVTCPYHSWLFDLSGKCRRAPFMQDSANFDLAAHNLRAIRYEIWNGFVFVNLSGDALPLGPQITGLTSRLADRHIEEMFTARTTDWGVLDVDWKVLLENAMECYHHVGTHSKTLQPIYPAELSWTEPEGENYVLTYAVPKNEAKEDEKLATTEMLKRTTGQIITIFPLAHFMVRSDGMSLLLIFPLGPGKIQMMTHVIVPKSVAEKPDFEQIVADRAARSKMILGEDFDMCVRLQKMTSTNSIKVGRLSQLEEPLWRFYRYLAQRIKATATKSKVA